MTREYSHACQARMVEARRWAAEQVRRDIEWQLYAALRDSVNQWRDMPLPSETFLAGFYGRDYADE